MIFQSHKIIDEPLQLQPGHLCKWVVIVATPLKQQACGIIRLNGPMLDGQQRIAPGQSRRTRPPVRGGCRVVFALLP